MGLDAEILGTIDQQTEVYQKRFKAFVEFMLDNKDPPIYHLLFWDFFSSLKEEIDLIKNRASYIQFLTNYEINGHKEYSVKSAAYEATIMFRLYSMMGLLAKHRGGKIGFNKNSEIYNALRYGKRNKESRRQKAKHQKHTKKRRKKHGDATPLQITNYKRQNKIPKKTKAP